MPPTLLRVYHTLSQVIPNSLMSWSRSYPQWTARRWIHRWPSLTVSKDWLDGGLRGQFIEERHMCVTKCLDFVHSHFEPVHLNNFSLISSYTQTSRPWHGQLPAKQKVGESRSLQGTAAYRAAAREMPLHIHHRTGPVRPDCCRCRRAVGRHLACSGKQEPLVRGCNSFRNGSLGWPC